MRPLTSRPRVLSAAAAAALLSVLAVAGCSAGSDDGGGSTADGGAALAEREAGAPPREAAADAPYADGLSDFSATGADTTSLRSRRDEEVGMEPAIISKGNVSLTSEDVEKTAFDVQEIADEYAGEVTDKKTSTDEEGEVRFARMVLRIPADDYSEAFAELEQVADLESSSSTSEDVTTQVIDNRVRIRAQRRSLQRVEVLLDRAQSIRDIVAIEAQLTRRQAELDSLEQRQAYLLDQTSMSTITVNVEKAEEEKSEKEEDEAGFVAGLSAGWTALGTFATALATATGALLPFAVVLLVIGAPVLLLVRRVRRRSPAPAGPADA